MVTKCERPGGQAGALTDTCRNASNDGPDYTAAGGVRKPPLWGVATDVAPPWAAADRDWFAAHPGRAHRLRAAYPDEPATSVLVRQVQPGLRIRLGVETTGRAWPDNEIFLHAMCDGLLESRTGTVRRQDVERSAQAPASALARRQ